MVRHIQLRDLFSERFLHEIHHFLWTDPSFSGDVVDAGWNCRDHAWVTALLAQALGYKCALVHGEAFFVKARTTRSGHLSYYQKPHSWVTVEGVGAIDLSIKPDFSSCDDHFRIPIKCIFAGECIPRGKGRTFFFDRPDAYDHAARYPWQLCNEDAAVYLIREAEQLHGGHMQYAAGWIGSPLTVRLDAAYGNASALYAVLLSHMRAFLEGRTPSMATLSSEESWRRLADRREGVIDPAAQSISILETSPV